MFKNVLHKIDKNNIIIGFTRLATLATCTIYNYKFVTVQNNFINPAKIVPT